MLLEAIELKNFRQFRNEKIEFAQGVDGRNVTIILGENGTGKTTFAQAFRWCLYGKTDFLDQVLLNKLVAGQMMPGQSEEVRVQLKLQHGQVHYTLIRQQVYHFSNSGKLRADSTTFAICLKKQDGNTEYIKASQLDNTVRNILPEDLSRFFFFDGERIEKMSKEISSGKSTEDFANAVRALLGLNGMISALKHLNPKSTKSVVGSFNKDYDSGSDAHIAELTKTITDCVATLERIDAEIENADRQIDDAEERKQQNEQEIRGYKDGQEQQAKKSELEQRMQAVEAAKVRTITELFDTFHSGMSTFFSLRMMNDSLEFLSGQDILGKDIPSIDYKTIDYLLKNKVCLCGTHLDEGSIPYQKIVDLIQYLPPQSISTTVSDYKREARSRLNRPEDLPSKVKETESILVNQDAEISDYQEEIRAVEDRLSRNDVDAVRALYSEIKVCEKTIQEFQTKRDELLKEKGAKEETRKRTETQRQELSLKNGQNRKIEMCQAYAMRLYDKIYEIYTSSEEKVRERLQNTINEIFCQIYEGGLSVAIDEKYRLTVTANNYEGEVETSSAQSVAVIFAFITGIIRMARENQNLDNNLLTSEPYPLVMDAPLSTFDKRRIRTVCESLPKTAEQVIIFIKDTDGELAERHLGEKIGSRHSFEKKNEFETRLR